MIRPIYVSGKCPAVVSPLLALRVKRSSKIRHQGLVPRIWLKTGRVLLFLSKNFTQVRFRPPYSASRSQFPLKSFSSYSWKDGDINHWRACRKANYQRDFENKGEIHSHWTKSRIDGHSIWSSYDGLWGVSFYGHFTFEFTTLDIRCNLEVDTQSTYKTDESDPEADRPWARWWNQFWKN